MTLEELLPYIIEQGRVWVQAQRDHHRPCARPLAAAERAALEPFFEGHILDIARVGRVPIVENPGFYEELEARGVSVPLDFADSEGITFVDTVLISQEHHPQDPPQLPLLFHELVHAVQYSLLGRDTFVERYVRGWAEAGQDYSANPLERSADQLQERYKAEPRRAFSVEAEVRRHLGLT